ncbi:Npun_R2821/Npun_R2822 family protein [Nodularia spumigena]|uniref:Npun_R2821/Npun_R2822 family protein n=1 Tax=Nodularia spumigena TaxID=70799 RepID=UPI00232B1442|nr:Npun_R2821/Npun_R2822 family protein [Nodularia spumigena]MDB9316359.1 methionine synthase [Nodularia spumigena CS-590/01A]MDB9327711.1 methionine synthase [Nodularia spumigena CS-590/02]
MTRGIYIIANDKVTDQAIALLNSIRLHDADTPIVMIPYDENYHNIADTLNKYYGVTVYEDLDFIERLAGKLHETFGGQFFARPNQFRKQACWFGPFDEFLYIDTDIVVFEKISNNLDYLAESDFIYCDYQHLGGIKNVFSPQVLRDKVFTETEVKDIFNGGFWGSKKNLVSENDLYETFAECAAHPEYFDFSEKTSDQPIINYMLLKRISRRFNIVKREGKAPGNWAGTSHFQSQGNILFDPTVNQPLQYLHWAGIRIQPGCAYWQIWEYYRNRNPALPAANIPAPVEKSQLEATLEQVKNQLRKLKKGVLSD